MSNQSIKKIYERIFNEVYSQVETLEEGFLYQVIQVIVGEEQLEESREICRCLSISPNATRKDDRSVIDSFVEIIETTHPYIKNAPAKPVRNFLEGVSNQSRSFFEGSLNQPSEKEKMEEMKWIITGACILAGMYFCVKYLDKVSNRRVERHLASRKDTRQQPSPLSPPSPPSFPSPPFTAELCLVIPAKTVGTLGIGSDLRASEIAYLVDNASYFLCANSQEADSNERRLALEEYTPSDSQQEVYIRIHVSDGGQALIGKKIPYILKRNLSDTAQFTIEQLSCLRNLSGLEEFNLV